MRASTRPKRAKTHAVRGGSENQSRANKDISSVSCRNAVTTPVQRTVLTDVTNCSSLKTASRSREQCAIKDVDEAQVEMKKRQIAAPVRASVRISAAKAHESNTLAKENTNKWKASSVSSVCDEEQTIAADELVTDEQVLRKRGKRKLAVSNDDKQEVGQNDAEDLDTEKNSVSGENISNKKAVKAANLREESEKPTRQSKRLKLNLETNESEPRKPDRPQHQQNGKAAQPTESLESSAFEHEDVPGSPLASGSNYKSPIAKKQARQSKLTVHNKKLSIQTTMDSRTNNSKKVAIAELERRTSKRISKKNASLSNSSPRSASSSPLMRSSEVMKANQAGSGTKRKVQAKIDTLLSSPKFRTSTSSPKSSPARKSIRSSPKKSVDGKKVPIWKSEPKPEPLRSAADDVYDLEVDPKDVKQKKKRQRRLKNAEPVKRVKRARLEPDNLPPIELKLPENLAQRAKAVENPPTPRPEILSPKKVDTAEEDVASTERPSTLDLPLDESVIGPSAGVLPASTPINTSTPFVEEQPSMAFDPITPIVEPRMEDGECRDETVNSADVVQETPTVTTRHRDEQPKSKVAPLPLSLDNCFGFEEPEGEPEIVRPEVTKSTPIRAPRARAITPFRPSLSPVRNVVEANRKSTGSRPARVDLKLARDIISVHAVGACHDKKKQKTLKEFIEEADPVHRSVEEERPVYCPPTPPTVFSAPPRRSYTKREMRKVKKAMFKEHADAEDAEEAEHSADENEENDENDDWNSGQQKRKKKNANKKPKKTKQEKEVDEWAKLMAEHFDDIDKTELILSD